MGRVREIVGRFAILESRLPRTRFVAPRVKGGRVRTRIEGLVHAFEVRPQDFEGWAVFQPLDLRSARVAEPAGLAEVDRYLQLLKPQRARLAFRLRGRSWLAYRGDRPLVVHLVEGAPFDAIVARGDGAAWWHAEPDTRADPRDAERLRQALQEDLAPDRLAWSGLTPDMRATYELAWKRRLPRDPSQRLGRALRMGGGRLESYADRGDFWQVEWRTADGAWHSSAIGKADLTVMSSGICLSGQDRDFDLQSLVGVMEGR